MISAILPMAMAVGSALAGGSDDTPTPSATEAIEIRVDRYGFSAVNRTAHDHLFAFGHGDQRIVRALPAGEELSWPMPAGGTEGMTLAIVTPTDDGWFETREFSIDLQALTAGAPLYATANGAGVTAWTPIGSAAALGATSAPLGSAPCNSTSANASTAEQALFHVPSVTGLETAGPQEPPRLDDAPLPPI